jgi:hypothetical protein
MLVAQAQTENLLLLTSDEVLAGYAPAAGWRGDLALRYYPAELTLEQMPLLICAHRSVESDV